MRLHGHLGLRAGFGLNQKKLFSSNIQRKTNLPLFVALPGAHTWVTDVRASNSKLVGMFRWQPRSSSGSRFLQLDMRTSCVCKKKTSALKKVQG